MLDYLIVANYAMEDISTDSCFNQTHLFQKGLEANENIIIKIT